MNERKLKYGRKMTYEEVSLKLWESEGRKGNPISKQAVAKIEERALAKVKLHLAKVGFGEKEVMDYFAALDEVNEYGVME